MQKNLKTSFSKMHNPHMMYMLYIYIIMFITGFSSKVNHLNQGLNCVTFFDAKLLSIIL